MGQATAQLNLSELSRQLGYPEDQAAAAGEAPLASVNGNKQQQLGGVGAAAAASAAARRKSMEQLDLLKMTPDQKATKRPAGAAADLNKSGLLDEEDFFDFISRYISTLKASHICNIR